MRQHKPIFNEEPQHIKLTRISEFNFFTSFGSKPNYPEVLKLWCHMITKMSTVEHCCNDIGLYDTWHITSDILRCQLIPYCYT